MSHKILINCSNLHSGGGVAVASSFIDCLSQLNIEGFDISLLLSTSVGRNLQELGIDTTIFSSCIIKDFYGIAAIWQGLDRHFQGMDLIFTVFGPAYYARKHNTRHLFGFAQPNIIYPNNLINQHRSFFARLRTRLKYGIQSYFFSRADMLVVELEHVKSELSKIRLFQKTPIQIVHSSVHSVFYEPKKWFPLSLPQSSGKLKLGIISRNYPHKNLSILANVKYHLLKTYGRDVDFYVTFQPNEWTACNAEFRDQIINVGGLTLSQCPSFYTAMDGVIFPSLLECFSAVPIETMMLHKPLFASNLSFICDVCDDHCNYFNPFDAADIARVIHEYFCLPDLEKIQFTNAAYKHVLRYPSPDVRAENYMNIIKSILE